MIKRQYPEDPEAAVDVDVDVDGEGEPDYTETWNSASPPPPKRLRAATKDDKKPATTKSAPKAKVKKESAASAPGKRSGTWSSDELMRLYEQMCPKRTGVNWTEVGEAVGGRDAKSCSNKWTRIQSKIAEAIISLGE